jgi:ribosome recycling factor
MRLEDELRRAQERLERLERQMREEIDNVHKQYRRDLVLYQTPRPVRTRAQ